MGRRTKKNRPPDNIELPRLDPPRRYRINYAAAGVCAFLLLAVVAIYSKTVVYDFVYLDDYDYICDNPYVRIGPTVEGIKWAFTSAHVHNWHPLTWISHMLDCGLFGLSPGGHHAGNILFHAATAILLFLVLKRMTGDMWPSAFAAAVFAVHPLRVESVAWVAERKDVLSGMFFMLTLAAYVGYVRHPFSLVRYLAVAVLFALGLMAKPMLVTLPFVLLLLDYWPLGRIGPEVARKNRQGSITPQPSSFSIFLGLVLEKVPLFAMAGGSCMATVWAQTKAMVSEATVKMPDRLANAAVSYVTYIGQFFYPAGLAVPYPYPEKGLPKWEIAGAFIVLAIISAAVVVLWRRLPYLLTGWLWYLGMLVPVIGLVQVGSQAMADRYTYLPQIGLCIAIAWSVERITRPWPNRRWICGIGSAIVLLILMGCAWRQTSFWRNTEVMCVRAIECVPENSVALANLGAYYYEHGQPEKALEQFKIAVKISPKFANAYNNIGAILLNKGQAQEATNYFVKALLIDPDFADAHTNLGVALAAAGHMQEAIDHHKRALQIYPNHIDAHLNMVRALLKLGRLQEAIDYCNEVIRLKPDCAEAYSLLGLSMLRTERPADAVVYYKQALRFKPDYAEATFELAQAYAKTNQPSEAMDMARKAVKIAQSHGQADYVELIENWMNSYRARRSSGF
jgi:protein O-mannosyl-transferase